VRNATLVATFILLLACDKADPNLATYQVERGEFLVTHFEAGEIQAVRGEIVMSPRIGGRLKITDMAPEGEQIDVGDLIIQFDPAEFEAQMLDREALLEQAHSDFAKAKAQRNQTLADIKRKIEQQQATLRLAELSMERQRFASSIDQELARISMEKTKRGLQESYGDSVAQEVINRVDFQRHQLSIARNQERYNRAHDNYERTRVYATRPGIVVYRKIRKPGSSGESKVAVGDNIWGGHALMDIPDLSQMQVRCMIGEMDIKRMRVGQKVFIRLEAFPGPVFNGTVSSLSPMATPQPGAPEIRVFDIYIDIKEQDERLKPGMSTEAEIVLEHFKDTLSVPLSAIFNRRQTKIVYRLQNGDFTAVEVELGQRNASSIVVSSGLQEGDIVALEQPQ